MKQYTTSKDNVINLNG